jgi:hypothetical protein
MSTGEALRAECPECSLCASSMVFNHAPSYARIFQHADLHMQKAKMRSVKDETSAEDD